MLSRVSKHMLRLNNISEAKTNNFTILIKNEKYNEQIKVTNETGSLKQ